MKPFRLHSSFSFVLTASVAALILASCGGSGASGHAKPIVGGDVPLVTPTAVPDGVARLVPADAPVTVYIHDPDKLLAAVRDLARQIQPGSEAMLSADTLLSQTPFDLRARELDLSQPLAVVVGPEGPMHAVVAAADDPTDLADSKDSTAGRYAALAMPGRSAPKAGDASKALQALPSTKGAGLTVRIDLGQFRDQIEQGEQAFHQMAESQPAGGLILEVYQPLFDFCKRGGVIDLMLEFEGDAIQLSAVMDVGIAPPASVPGRPTVYELLTRVPTSGDNALVFAFGPVMSQFSQLFDVEKLMTGAFAPGEAASELPAEFNQAMKDYVAAVAEAYAVMDGGGAGTFALGDGGMEGAWAMTVSEPARAAAAVDKMAKAAGRMGFVDDVQHEAVEAGSARFDFVDAKWDAKKLIAMSGNQVPPGVPDMDEMMQAVYGERLRLAFGQADDIVLATVGLPASGLVGVAAAAQAGGQDHGAAARLLAEVPGEQLILFAHLDLLAMLRPMARAMADRMGPVPALPEGRVPMTMSIGCTGTRYRFNLGFDVAAMAKIGR
ncbi:MAG: hypothetical protein NXI31_12990 [bacterium]|nr:hypothetical protein [bacterium]